MRSLGRQFAGSLAVLFVALFCCPSLGAAKEPWLLDVEGGLGLPLAKPQSDWYGLGGTLALSVQRPLVPWVALTARLRTAGFLDGHAPKQAGTEDPSFGTLNTLAGGFVLRVPSGDVRRATGFFVDAVAGGGFTGDKLRGMFDVGMGYGFAASERISVAPVVRYIQVIQPSGGLSGADAKLGFLGVRLSFFENRPEKEPPPPPVLDRDGDGIADAVDQCPDTPEDFDEFEDEDGCPEPDNDNDGILDEDDACPNIPEDKDGFQDEDGCLDDDNDRDGFLDEEDQCPLEPETINGVDDDDGCPDQGLIVMEDDRIVLEDHVLFDTDRARVKSSAEPVLQAIVHLWRQHPEWKKVRIEGHADARGNAEFNQHLSERRAANVRDALVKLGLDRDMVTAEGFGARRLLTTETTEEAHQRNRRVEFVVIAREVKRLSPLPDEESEGAQEAPEHETPAESEPPAAPAESESPAAPAESEPPAVPAESAPPVAPSAEESKP